MKVLIIGGSGLLGSNLSFYLSNKFDVLSTYNKHKFETKKFKFTKLNIENYTEIKNVRKTKVIGQVTIQNFKTIRI